VFRAGFLLALLATMAADLAPILVDVQVSGASSLREMAAALNERGILTARGGEWSAMQVKRLLAQI
jgi:Recombinase